MKKTAKAAMIIAAAILTASVGGCGSSAAPATQAPATQAPATQAPAQTEAPKEQQAESKWVPEKDIELVIPMSPGGGSDVFARKMAEIITEKKLCPVNIVPVNKQGGSGVVGYTYLTGKKDEYSIATTSSSFYTQPGTGNSPLDPSKDFIYIANMCKDPSLVVINASLKINSLDELIEYQKANPGKLKFGGSSNASDDTILMYMINDLAGIDLTYVPFDGGSDVLAAILGGHIDVCAISPSEAGEHLTAGTLTPLAVSADSRLASLPDVKTFSECGLDIAHQQNRGIVMAAGASEEVAEYYSDLFRQVSETDEWQTFLKDQEMQSAFMDHKAFTEYNNECIEEYNTYLQLILANQ